MLLTILFLYALALAGAALAALAVKSFGPSLPSAAVVLVVSVAGGMLIAVLFGPPTLESSAKNALALLPGAMAGIGLAALARRGARDGP
jgi:hypothetical protein